MNVTIEERSDKFLTAKWRMDAGGLVKIDNLEELNRYAEKRHLLCPKYPI